MSEALARRFHAYYEKLAPEYGYETRSDTKNFDPDTDNGRLMIAVCTAICKEHTTEVKSYSNIVGHLNDKVAALEAALIWCSGSGDFQVEGKARVGWLKICKPLIESAVKEEEEKIK